jgi:membrane protease YdiL (CAAX protease family)
MTPPPPQTLAYMLVMNALIFGAAVLFCWGVEALWKRIKSESAARRPFPPEGAMRFGAALRFALRHFVWMLPATLLLSFGFNELAQLCGFELPQQEVVVWMTSPDCVLASKVIIAILAVVEAPILEELLFRRFVFRAFLTRCPLAVALLASGALFAAVHGYIATFLPLTLLGAFFGWIYYRTGRLTAAIFFHFLFNLSNLLLMILFPELATA